jgi:NAD-dependent deacetylase
MNEKVVERLSQTRFLLVITGAGISAESGIPTFRGTDGLWKNYRAEELATPEAFKQNPETVWQWYDWRRGIIGKAPLNPGHLAIKELEDMFENFLLITQNVDGLHARTGIRNMVEINGNLWPVGCTHRRQNFIFLDDES